MFKNFVFGSGNESQRRHYDLQLFADEGDNDTGMEENLEDDSDDKPEDKSDDKPSGSGSGEAKYTDADLDKIINQRFARWEKEKEKAVSEAKEEAAKLAKMNAQQKTEYELEKAQRAVEAKDAEIAELKKVQMRSELSRSAAQIMKEQHDIVATQDMLDFVVGDDAEQTNTLIEKLMNIIKEDRKAQEKARATGNTPKHYGGNGNKMSEIDRRIAKYS